MPTSDPVTVLLTQNRWATRNLIEACAKLPAGQLHQPFEMGRGSLHHTIVHILSAMQGWGDLLAGREPRPPLGDETRSPEQLVALLDEFADDLDASAAAHPVDELLTGSRGGRSYTFARGGVLAHVTTHGMHHRAQALNMLRQLGVEPLPPSAVVEWILMADG